MLNNLLRFMIVDDEPIAHRIIEDYSSALPHLKLINNSYNALEAIEFLNRESIDVIFLDINMPKLTGFELLRTLSNPPQVIVTSAYQEFALEGYELNVVDYLVKPFSLHRFLTAVNKLKNTPKVTVMFESNERPSVQTIYIKGDKKHHQINLKDISHIEANGNYSLVYTNDRKIITHEKISSFEQILPDDNFLRIHKSYIVAKAQIRSISANLIHLEHYELPIGQTYKLKVNELLSNCS